jgi:hypothetical protein
VLRETLTDSLDAITERTATSIARSSSRTRSSLWSGAAATVARFRGGHSPPGERRQRSRTVGSVDTAAAADVTTPAWTPAGARAAALTALAPPRRSAPAAARGTLRGAPVRDGDTDSWAARRSADLSAPLSASDAGACAAGGLSSGTAASCASAGCDGGGDRACSSPTGRLRCRASLFAQQTPSPTHRGGAPLALDSALISIAEGDSPSAPRVLFDLSSD